MRLGILPAVNTKFTAKDELDIDGMQRCFALQMQAGGAGPIACGAQVEALVKAGLRNRPAIPVLD